MILFTGILRLKNQMETLLPEETNTTRIKIRGRRETAGEKGANAREAQGAPAAKGHRDRRRNGTTRESGKPGKGQRERGRGMGTREELK